MDKKTIVIYYSNSGTTAQLAQKIGLTFGCEVLSVVPEESYGTYFEAVRRAGKERKSGEIPAYTAPDLDLADIDAVFIGYPIWYSAPPAFLLDYVKKLDLRGKTVIPFSTSGATNIRKTLHELRTSAGGAAVKCPYNYAMLSKDDFSEWAASVNRELKR